MKYKNIVLITARHTNQGWGTGNFIYKALKNLGCNIVRDYDFRRDYGKMHFPEDADLLLAWKGSGINVEQLGSLQYKKVMWYPDDIRYEHGFNDASYLCGHFDKWYTVIAENAPVMEQLFNQKAAYLPSGVDIETFRLMEMGAKDIDVLFIGNPHSKRKEYLEHLAQNYINTKIICTNNVFLDDMCALIARAKIIFNYGSFNRGMQLRIPEVLACGGFLLTNYNRFVGQDFIPGKHLMMYGNKYHFADLCNYYLEHSVYRKKIAADGYAEIGKHTWEKRLTTIFADLDRPPSPVLIEPHYVVDSPHTPIAYSREAVNGC